MSRLFHSSLGSMVHEHCVEKNPETQQASILTHQKLGLVMYTIYLHQPMVSYWESSLVC